MTALDALCPNYEVVFPENGDPMLTFDLAEVPTLLPRQITALSPSEDGLIVTLADGQREVRVHFEALPDALRERLAYRSSLLVAALDEHGVAFANEVDVGWSKPRRGVRL